jgi:hypothetical protein
VGKILTVVDQVQYRTPMSSRAERPPLHPADERGHGRFLKLALPCRLERKSQPGFDVINCLTTGASDPRRLEEYPAVFDRNAPALLEQVSDQKTNRSQFLAGTIINVLARKIPQSICKARRRSVSKIEQ